MAFSLSDVKTEVILGLKAGGQIPAQLIDYRSNLAIKHIFVESGVLVLPRYINETAGEHLYHIELGQSGVSFAHTPTNIETIRFVNLYRVDEFYSTPGNAQEIQSKVKSRSLVSPHSYCFEEIYDASTTTNYIKKLRLYSESTKTKTYGFELLTAVSTTEVGMIDDMYLHEFREAVINYVKYQFLNDTGKPYSEPNLGQIHYKLYLEFLNKLKVKAYRGFINRDISAQPAVKPFIV